MNGFCGLENMDNKTEEEFREAVEERLKLRLSDDVWRKYHHLVGTPYNDTSILAMSIRLREDGIISTPEAQSHEVDNDHYDPALLRSQLIPESVQEKAEKCRVDIFGDTKPPFLDIASMREWILSEAKLNSSDEGDAPRFGYKLDIGADPTDKDIERLKEEFKKRPGPRGIEWPTVKLPPESGLAGGGVPAKGPALRLIFHTASQIVKEIDCQESQATAYILIGCVPYVPSLSYEVTPTILKNQPSRGEIVITIREPVSEDEVIELYKKLRKQLWGRERIHSIKNRDYLLVEFVAPRLKPNNPQWESLRKEWNRQYPEFIIDYWQRFRVAYKRAYDKIYPDIILGPVRIK